MSMIIVQQGWSLPYSFSARLQSDITQQIYQHYIANMVTLYDAQPINQMIAVMISKKIVYKMDVLEPKKKS